MERKLYTLAAAALLFGLLGVVGQTRRLFGQEKLPAGPNTQTTAVAGNSKAAASSALRGSRPASRSWAPPDVDEEVSPVKPGVPCSLPETLQGAGQSVQELVTNLSQFTATERVEHTELDRKGNGRPLVRSFKYLVSISETQPVMLGVDETRDGSASPAVFPSRLATKGLAAFALVFHPDFSSDFEMACEGLGEWHGQPAWQVHFHQRQDKLARIHSFRIAGRVFAVKLKGRAWISADTHQVVRLELDLMQPIPEIQLDTEHMDIEYRPVQFTKRHLQVWLPQSADLYVEFLGHRYHQRHSFSDFLLFSVDVTQHIEAPKEPD